MLASSRLDRIAFLATSHIVPLRRPRKLAGTAQKATRDIYLFAGVPYYDIGGGQRSAQLAKTFNKMGYAVHYVYAYESSESGARTRTMPIPAVTHMHISRLAPERIVAQLRGDPLFIFEMPSKQFVPYLDLARRIGATVIYEHIDNWDTSLGSLFFDPDVFKTFLMSADAVVATTHLLRDNLTAYMRGDPELASQVEKVHYAANAVDTELFDAHRRHDLPPDLVRGKQTLLYYGSLWGEWFDWDLIQQVAQACPACAINLIGDERPIQALARSMPVNVHFLGPKPQSSLPTYLQHSDVALLPFKNDEIGKYVSPLKVFEYIAMHKPVLATPLPDIVGYPNVYTSDDAENWVRFVQGQLAVDGDVEAGMAFAQANTWYARCDLLLDLVAPEVSQPCAPPPLTVIVLNHNNRTTIFRCIDSLLSFRDRYHYDIVVVDNQSTDGSYELLRERYQDTIVLLRNARNGCASGRNLGLARATGQLVLFLDSDQWALGKRWLDAPLAVLKQQRNIGAVGWTGGWFYRDQIGGPTTEDLPQRGVGPAILFRTDVGYLGSGGLLVRREALNGVDSFDEYYDPTCYEDNDLSLQIRDRGFELAYCPYIGVGHLPHQTTKAGSDAHTALMKRNARYFFDKWKKRNPSLLTRFYAK